MVRAAGEKHQAAALTPVGSVKMTESLKEDRRRRKAELMPYRQFYSPFMNSTIFSNWVIQNMTNFINGIKAL